jgi:hypothetical protein
VRLLIVAAVAALTAILATFLLKEIDGPWNKDSSVRSAIVGAVSGVVGMSVARWTRRKD